MVGEGEAPDEKERARPGRVRLAILMPKAPMSKSSDTLISRTSLILLRPLLAALDATGTAILKATSSLPAPCFRMPAIRTLACATPINTLPVFRAAMIWAAVIGKVDVLCVEHGFAPETLDEVTIDVMMARGSSIRMIVCSVTPMRSANSARVRPFPRRAARRWSMNNM